ncbi:MAG TPA: DUF1254 domain-containing protein [Casimicrobiaceae bacterium]|nr:DUF1254 domain-containing protein [Casimicrobiaceae bacterium]
MLRAASRLLAALAAAALVAACGKSEPPPPPPPPPKAEAPAAPTADQQLQRLAREVYVYAYPLVLMDVTREVMTAKAPINTFQNKRSFPDPSFTDVVSPNADTLYSSAWLDLSSGPVLLSVPDTKGRYYLMPMLDAWTNVFQSPGKRTIGTEKREFAIVGPKWKGELPKNAEEIRAPTDMVWIIGRTQTNGKADYAAVARIQDQFKLTPLSRSRKPAPASAASIDLKTPPVEQVAKMDARTFFSRVAMLLPDNPPAKEDTAMVERMKQLGIVPGQPFDVSKLDAASAKGLQDGAKSGLDAIVAAASGSTGDIKNGWIVNWDLGRYGTNYGLRAITAYVGLGANAPEDAIYPYTHLDGGGRRLNGANRYVLHFDKGKTPPAEAFWSLTMYNDKHFFVANPIDRYAIGDRDKLHYNANGSLDLYIQNENPGKDKESNWLPAPKGDFNLILRVYWPKQEMLERRWEPPAVQRVS